MDALKEVTGKRYVMGVSLSTMGAALRRLRPDLTFARFDVPWVITPGGDTRPTFTQFLVRTRAERDAGTFYLISTTTHFLVLRGRTVWDNSTPPGGVTLSKAPSRRSRVTSVRALVSNHHVGH